MKLWIIGAVVVIAPLQVAAQQASSESLASLGFKIVKPMSPKQTAAARSRVDAELAAAGVSAFFDNVTDGNGGKARHRPSGLLCPLGKKGQRVVSASADAAICATRNGDASYLTSVVRAPSGATLQGAAADLLASAEREDGYAPFQGTSVTAHPSAGSGRPDHQTLRFSSRVDGHRGRSSSRSA